MLNSRYPAVDGHPRIVIDPTVMTGKPCIRGTRIPVDILLDQLSVGESADEIISGYLRLTRDDIAAALSYAADALRPTRLPDAAE